LIYSLEVLKMQSELNSKFPPNTNESGANLSYEEGVTSSLTLAPPYYSYTYLLMHTPPKTPN